ncbi:hypothetical protein C1Y40_03347 [Mycobacterium talmoniae]|uniref:Uncharacterized protein n=1 Tax=Mycobacterium talmoniae TaxID=1858794 RepID=A0A2S8BIQ6_9MYCO|nr:hypothetical protein C1Y40_03347 [Mycobacterium talmoniae]
MIRVTRTALSTITSRGESGGGPVRIASSARGAGGGRNGWLLDEKITANERVRRAKRAAKTWAIMPPIEAPTTCARSMPRWSSTAAPSSAMSSSVYTAGLRSPRKDRSIRTGSSPPACRRSSLLDRPTSRLSYRITRRPCAASFSQKPVRHSSSCAPNPMISSTAGSFGLPMSS